MAMCENEECPVCITGMHRSGTSMVTRLLHICGLYLGSDDDLMPAKKDNPGGYWENLKFVGLNDEILNELGGGWDHPPPSSNDWIYNPAYAHLVKKGEVILSEFRGRSLWGWKDPRNSLILPFWLKLRPGLKVIHCVRNPLEVALSLQKRNFFSYSHSLSLWMDYNQRVLQSVAPEDLIVIHFETLFLNGNDEIQRILKMLKMTVPNNIIEGGVDTIKLELYHSRCSTQHVLDLDLAPEVLALYLELCDLADWSFDDRTRQKENSANIRRVDNSGSIAEASPENIQLSKAYRRKSVPSFVNRDSRLLDGSALELIKIKKEKEILHRQMAEHSKEIRELKNTIETYQNIEDQMRRVTEENTQLSDNVEALQRTLSNQADHTASLLKVMDRIQMVATSLTLLSGKFDEQSEQIFGISSLVDGLCNRDNAFQEKLLDTLNHFFETHRDYYSALDTKYKDHSTYIESVSSKLGEIERRFDELQKSKEEVFTGNGDIPGPVNNDTHETGRTPVPVDREGFPECSPTVPATPDRRAKRRTINAVHKLVQSLTPPKSTLLVFDDGDSEFINFRDRDILHFRPRRDDSSRRAEESNFDTSVITQFEALRWQGAQYLLLPQAGFSWLDRHNQFKLYLNQKYSIVSKNDETCLIFDISNVTSVEEKSVCSKLKNFVDDCRSRFSHEPIVLDWDTSLDLVNELPQCTVFSPPKVNDKLPYFDNTIDIVVIKSTDTSIFEQALRAADTAVITIEAEDSADSENPNLKINWVSEKNTDVSTLKSSIIIPCYNAIDCTITCINSLQETIPPYLNYEIIVVDDASDKGTFRRLESKITKLKNVRILRNRKNLGFLGTCNHGAEHAKGEILVFLNNDTISYSNWLFPILNTFRDYPSAGAVGGKLMFPNGTLQEAGGVVFRDGSAANFGKGDKNVESPLYNYVREVDYCSGALLATKSTLFRELGKFDEQFAPGYYEDTDYCFTLRSKGFDVLYQPESAVIHIEGGTAGTDLTVGMKRFQVVNHEKFLNKWRRQLADQPLRPEKFDSRAWRRLANRTGPRKVG